MNKNLRAGLLFLVLLVSRLAQATTQWSAQDYDLYSGDFDGDGVADLLYVAKDPGNRSGIARGVKGGFDTSFESWTSDYLGISWSGNQYTVVILQNTNIGNKRANVLLQSNAAGGTGYLLQTDQNGRIVGISQSLSWPSTQYHIVAGDFNHDGFADVFLQPTSPAGSVSVFLANSSGQFSPSSPAQTWTDASRNLGFKWATTEAVIYAGDFNGDGYTDLLIQARPQWVTINYGVPFPVPTYPPNLNGIAFAHASGQLFSASAVTGETLGYYAWSRKYFGVDWSPLVTKLVVGNFSGSGYSDILLQALHSNQTSYLVTANGTSSVFANGTALASNLGWSADTVRLIAGNYSTSGTPSTTTGVYFQALTSSGTNSFTTSVTGSSVSTTTMDPTVPPAGLAVTAAGRTPGTFAVSSSGSATYTVPLWTPPGVHGIQPHLALVYNSHQPDGYLGPGGWTLPGLSSISRCNGTWAQDGVPTAVTLTTADRYCIDGQRLRITSSGGLSGYGTAGSTYQTEIANFSNVTASSTTTGNGPAYFTVRGKDGLYYEYGNPTDAQGQATYAQALASGSSTPYGWALDKVSDRAGNSMVIHYVVTNGTLLPSTIQYTYSTGNSGNTGYKVSFTYGSRLTGSTITYLGGASVQQPNVLDTITVSSSGTTVRVYNLSYTASSTTQRGTLTSIQECAGSAGTDCLPLTQIGYQGGAVGVANPTTSTGVSASNPATLTYAVDVDGDGRTDLVYATVSGSTNHWWVAFATGSGFGTPVDTGIVVSTSTPVLVDDFLGNGKVDLLAPLSNTWQLYQWNSGTRTFTPTTAGASYSSLDFYATADVNGDGVPDLVWTDGANVYTQLNTTPSGGSPLFSSNAILGWTITNTYSAYITSIKGNHSYPNSSVQKMDFNGDGRDDIAIPITSGGVVLLISQGSASAPTFTNAGYSWAGSVVPVNWNNDPCTDVYSWYQAAVWISACNGAGGSGVSVGTAFTAGATGAALDWDGDGQMDLLVYNGTSWTAYLSAGGGAPKSTLTPTLTAGAQTVVLDADGDGLNDLVSVAASSGALTYGLHNSAGTAPDLANSFTDGWGINYSPSYVSIAQGSYVSEAVNGYPDPDWIVPMPVVSAVTSSDGSGGTYSQSFVYYYRRMNLQGRGFDGFYGKRTYDSRNQTYEYNDYQQVFPYTGLQFYDQLYQSDNATQIRLVQSSFSSLQLMSTVGNQQVYPYVSQTTESDNGVNVGGGENGTLISQKVTTYSTPDNYGNFSSVSEVVTDQDRSSPWYSNSWSNQITTTWSEDSTDWCLTLPSQVATTRQFSGGTAQTRTVTLTNDYANCRLIQQNLSAGSTTLSVAEKYGYDGCGNINSITYYGQSPSGSAMPARTTSYGYGTRCQLPETLTNALNESATTAYNYNFGVPTSQTDPNGLTTTWAYDDFAREIEEWRPDGTIRSWSLSPCGGTPNTCAAADLRFEILVSEVRPGGAGENSQTGLYYDGLGRQRLKQSQNLTGGFTNSLTYYDQMGRVSAQYEPYSGTTVGYEQYTYDLLNRLKSDTLYQANGAQYRQATHTYVGHEVVITDANGNSTDKWYNVLGQLGQISDPAPGGVTHFGYDAFGHLTSILESNGHAQSWGYDLDGHLINATDADRGSWTYGPDSLGEVISQTDAKGQTTSFAYDLLGRMTSRTESEGTSTWTWGSSATYSSANRNYDHLVSISGPGGYSEQYVYDSLARPSTATYVAGSSNQGTYTYTYDPNTGLPASVSYPASTGTSPLTVQYGYQYNILSRITDASTGTVYWQVTAQDARGRASAETLGNGVNIVSNYDPLTGHLSSRTSGTTSPYTSQQNLSFTYDLNENLADRIDINQNSLDEHFNYDALNRVTGSTLAGVSNLSVGYDSTGNVTSRSDVGSYTYTPTSSHEVASTSNGWSFGYDANGNMTSGRGATITWTSYNLPSSITNGSYSSTFSYTPDRHYWQQNAVYSNGAENTTYLGGLFEIVSNGTVTDYHHLIPAGDALIVLVRSTGGNNNTYYVTQDHLGSSSVVTNSSGTAVLNQSFASFGSRRRSTWTGSPSSTDWTNIALTTRHGFTGQTMLDNLNLVHLNGRLYDPVIGRFMSPDPVIPDPTDAQSFNRYSYVNNNPLMRIDPTGFDSQCPGNDPSCVEGGINPQILSDPQATIYFANGTTYDGGMGYRDGVTAYYETGSVEVGAPPQTGGVTLDSGTSTHESVGFYLGSKNDSDYSNFLGRFNPDTGIFSSAFDGVSDFFADDLVASFGNYGARVLAGAQSTAQNFAVASVFGGLIVTSGGGGAATEGAGAAGGVDAGGGILYHYTTKEGMQGILDSEELLPSLKSVNPKDALYGNGQYLSDIQPGTMTGAQLSRQFLGMPFQGARFTNWIGIDTTGLNVIQGRAGVFLIPNEGPLDLAGRIVGWGAN